MNFDPRTNAREDESDLIIKVQDWDRAKMVIFWLIKAYGGRGISFMRVDKNTKVEISCVGCKSDYLYHEIVGYAKGINDVLDRVLG